MIHNEDVAAPEPGRKAGSGLASRLLFLTVLLVLAAEAMIFLPSAAAYRVDWLKERINAGEIAILALEASPGRMVSEELSRRLLENAQLVSVAIATETGREMILRSDMPVEGTVRLVDLRDETLIRRIREVIYLASDDETDFLRVLDTPSMDGAFVEIIVPLQPLRRDVLDYSHRILWLSLFISGFTGLLIYLVLLGTVIRPMQRITASIERFRRDPQHASAPMKTGTRSDEIGAAQNALADMEDTVRAALKARQRLALIGESVAKINHDLRNSLTAAQLVSEGLAASEDPRVQRAAPRLERAIERAITLTGDTLRYGRTTPPDPVLQNVLLHETVEEAALEGLSGTHKIDWENALPGGVVWRSDPDHIHRIFANLVRNAAQAMSGGGDSGKRHLVRASMVEHGDRLELRLADTGPGIPERHRGSLFKPFASSTTPDGSGLGLAIAHELATGLGGDLKLDKTGPDGTVFRLVLPRPEPKR